MLTSGERHDGSWLEIRTKTARGMRQEFIPSRAHRAAAVVIERCGRETETFVGVAPRWRHGGKKEDVARAHMLWVDADTPEAGAALERFAPKPSMVIASGGPGCLHAYWSLLSPASPDEAERANRRLAHALGADMSATDCPRVLRPPSTWSYKRNKPVTVEALNVETYTLEQVVGDLPDPPAAGVRRSASGAGATRPTPAGDDPLLAIRPPVHCEVLAGIEVDRSGKARCPFHHPDTDPSFHAYPTPEEGWTCFGGCPAPPGRRHLGGDIITFGAELYKIEPRGRGYWAIRERLEADLLGAVTAP